MTRLVRLGNLQETLDEAESFKDDAVRLINEAIDKLCKLDNLEDAQDILDEVDNAVYLLNEAVGNLE